MSYGAWENETVESVLAVTLSKAEWERSNSRKCWLKDVEKELVQDGTPKDRLIDVADSLIIGRLSIDPSSLSDDSDRMDIIAGIPKDETTFEYLTGCWKRLNRANRELVGINYSPADKHSWNSTFDKLKELIISYCGHTLEEPSMFPQPADKPVGPAEFLPILLNSSTISRPSDPLTASAPVLSSSIRPALEPSELPSFLSDLANRFAGDGLDGIFEATLSFLFQEYFKIVPQPDLVGDQWRDYLGALFLLCQVKAIAAMIPKLSVWYLSSAPPEQIEWMSLLGPLTRLSVFPRDFPTVWKANFANPSNRKKEDMEACQMGLRTTLETLQNNLFNIYNAIIRSSPDSREAVMAFFADVLAKNVKRAGMRVDPKKVSTDGYMINIQTILLRLFEPVMDVNYSKIDKIDVDYFRTSRRLDIQEETKIKATQEEANEYFAPKDGMEIDDSSPPNFISDLFFMLNAFQHLGLNKSINNRDRAEKNVREIKKELRKVEAEKPSWPQGSPQAQQGDALINKLKNDIETLKASVWAYDTQLLSKDLIGRNVSFLCFTMTWLIRLVDPNHTFPRQMIKLPLPEEAPVNFRMLPEYLIENIAEFLEFIVRFSPPETLTDGDKDTIVTFILVFLSPGYVNNPFLKAKFMAILAMGCQPHGYFRKGIFHLSLSYHSLATESLMSTLVRFFIDVESTGGHTQFWDKFNIRRDIDSIFKAMWDNPLHRAAFVKARQNDFDQFIRFVNMLMSDTTFHLDESLTGLAKIHSIKSQIASPDWESRPETERKDLESQLSQAEGSTPFHTQLGRSHVQLLRDFTATTKEPFLTPEIVDRLAATLDENIVVLVGPKMQELKVDDPDKYVFKPKELLAEITQIYINLGNEKEFVRAVAGDGRSYSKEVFEKLARVLKHRAVMVDAEIRQVLAFLAKVEEAKATIDMEDEREIPDEFLDPLMATLMKNPVILPMSRVTIDYGTIRAVLLSKPLDPFNNQPLKIEDCEPDVELKAKIDAWIEEGKLAGVKAQPAEDVDMDVENL